MPTAPSSLFGTRSPMVWMNGELNAVAEAPALPAEIAELIRRHTSLFHEWREAVNVARQAHAAADHQTRVDKQDEVNAVISGKKFEPKAPALAIKANELTDKAEVLGKAVFEVQDRIMTATEQARPTWMPKLDAARAQQYAELAEHRAKLDQCVAKLGTIDRIRFIVDDPQPVRWHASSSPIILPEVAEALQALHAHLR